jgi:hypothetical protein
MLNKLYVGFTKTVELPKGGCLFIDDEVRPVPEWRRPRTFDPRKHSFNPLKDLDYKRAREIADVLYTISPQGENTLTVRNGKRVRRPATQIGGIRSRLRSSSDGGQVAIPPYALSRCPYAERCRQTARSPNRTNSVHRVRLRHACLP